MTVPVAESWNVHDSPVVAGEELGTQSTRGIGQESEGRLSLAQVEIPEEILAGRDQLRGMLARLQEKEEVLLLGWGVKMPIPVRSRRYDQAFYDDMKGRKKKATNMSVDDINSDLFG